MTDTPRPRKHPGTSPLWANLPRRKCDDCGKSYKPVRPVKENERGFCTPNCRKSYHKHGGAYRKLKVEMKRMIEREFKEIHAALDGLLYRIAAMENHSAQVSARLDEVQPHRRQLAEAIKQSLSPCR